MDNTDEKIESIPKLKTIEKILKDHLKKGRIPSD
jgi:hypothetical protein